MVLLNRSGGIWGALTLGKEEEVNWNVSFNSSTNFKSMLVSMNLTFEGIMVSFSLLLCQ